MLGASRSADAAFSVTLSETGFTDLTINDGDSNDLDHVVNGTIAYKGDFGTFTANPDVPADAGIVLGVTSNSPGSNLPSLGGSLRDITLSTRNGDSGTATLTIFASSDGYTRPAGNSLTLRSTLSSSDVGLTAGTLSANTQAALTFTSTLISGATTTSPVSGVLTLTDPGTVKSDVMALRLNPTYTLQNTVTVTLGANGQVGLDATTRALVPEPATMAMAFTALPLLGLGYLRRRRSQA
jgi:hypothetical protein